MLAASVAVSGPANAASSPIAACGGGSYHEIDTPHAIGSIAKVYLLYNGTTDCVVTWLNPSYAGTKHYVMAWVQKHGDVPVVDGNQYAYYAGPVKVDAPGVCITWGGGVDGDNWYSTWVHCG